MQEVEMENCDRGKEINTFLLLKNFNNRDSIAFGKMYTHLHRELHYYTRTIYKNTDIIAEDILHDIFLHIWENRKISFETIKSLKSYIYLTIKNGFISYMRHTKMQNKKREDILFENDYYTIQVAEAEIYSWVSEATNMLPADCAETFRLFVEGYQIKEIAEMLNKPQSTIYSQRSKAISILKNSSYKEKLFLLPLTF